MELEEVSRRSRTISDLILTTFVKRWLVDNLASVVDRHPLATCISLLASRSKLQPQIVMALQRPRLEWGWWERKQLSQREARIGIKGLKTN
jgi:hypothetical protein